MSADEREQKLQALGEAQLKIRRILIELEAVREERGKLTSELLHEHGEPRIRVIEDE